MNLNDYENWNKKKNLEISFFFVCVCGMRHVMKTLPVNLNPVKRLSTGFWMDTWSGGIFVWHETASLSLETVLLRGTATPILMQWEYLPWYTTVTYRGLRDKHTDTALHKYRTAETLRFRQGQHRNQPQKNTAAKTGTFKMLAQFFPLMFHSV